MIISLVPVKETSERVPSKNFRSFHDGKSLLDILLDRLDNVPEIDHVFIASDKDLSPYESSSVSYLQRDPRFCNNVTSWSDVIVNTLSLLPSFNCDPIVLWSHVTGPLFDSYSSAINSFMDNEPNHDSLCVTEKLDGFFISSHHKPINYEWGINHPYSQKLEPIHKVTGSLFIARLSTMLTHKYVIGSKPFLFNVPHSDSIDIDTEDDYIIAQKLYGDSVS